MVQPTPLAGSVPVLSRDALYLEQIAGVVLRGCGLVHRSAAAALPSGVCRPATLIEEEEEEEEVVLSKISPNFIPTLFKPEMIASGQIC